MLLNRKQPSGSRPSESRSEPGAHNALDREQPIVQLKNVLYPAPGKFAKFAKFANFKTFTRRGRGAPYRSFPGCAGGDAPAPGVR